jgi:hypothetical protein
MLPSDYNRKAVGFIASSLKHSIVNSTWITTVGAYMILLDQAKEDKGNADIALTNSRKADIAGYQGLFKAREQERLEEYRLAYIKMLHFISEYFAGNLKVGLQKGTEYSIDLQTGEKFVKGLEPKLQGNVVGRNYRHESEPFKFKRLYINTPRYVASDYTSIISELNAPYPDGEFIQKRYQLVPTKGEVDKGNTGFLDTFKRDLDRSAALKKAQEIIKLEVNRLTDFKTLSEKAKPLADDLLKAIDTVTVEGAVRVNTRTGSSSASTNNIVPIHPLLQEDGLTVNYKVREGTPIKITYNPSDNTE